MTEKLLLLNQLLTDVAGLNADGEEREKQLILNKIHKIKEIEEEEIAKAMAIDAIQNEARKERRV